MSSEVELGEKNERLLRAIKARLGDIETILNPTSRYVYGEDSFYRLYHNSFKVYGLQKQTEKILQFIREIGEEAGADGLNPLFLKITSDGTGKSFNLDCNLDWGKQERPIVEAFFHAREMLVLMHRYGSTLPSAPLSLPSGWAAVLYLYNMR